MCTDFTDVDRKVPFMLAFVLNSLVFALCFLSGTFAFLLALHQQYICMYRHCQIKLFACVWSIGEKEGARPCPLSLRGGGERGRMRF